jgi:hypothetical protein
VPTDPDQRAAIATILGEGTPLSFIGTNQYASDQFGSVADIGPPKGGGISADTIINEGMYIAEVLRNRATRDNQSIEQVASAQGQFLGYNRGKSILDSGNFGLNGSDLCDKLKLAIIGARRGLGFGPSNLTGPFVYFNFRGVIQGAGRNRFVRQQGNARRVAHTDFF